MHFNSLHRGGIQSQVVQAQVKRYGAMPSKGKNQLGSKKRDLFVRCESKLQ